MKWVLKKYVGTSNYLQLAILIWAYHFCNLFILILGRYVLSNQSTYIETSVKSKKLGRTELLIPFTFGYFYKKESGFKYVPL